MNNQREKDELKHQILDDIPSPDELFKQEYEKKELVSAVRKKPIPRYRTVRRFSVGFIVFIVLFTLGLTQLNRLGYHYYYMRTESMESMIPKGSFLFEEECDSKELHVGDVITFISEDNLSVTHQIVRILPNYPAAGEVSFRTQGVENEYMDREIVTDEEIQGRVIFHIPYLGEILSGLK